jgi:hypothetical protein
MGNFKTEMGEGLGHIQAKARILGVPTVRGEEEE